MIEFFKSAIIDAYWKWRKLWFYAFRRDDGAFSLDFHWYCVKDIRNYRLIINKVNKARREGEKEVTINLYNHEPITLRWS